MGKANLNIKFHSENQVSVVSNIEENDTKSDILMFCFYVTRIISNIGKNETSEQIGTLLSMADSVETLINFKNHIGPNDFEIIDYPGNKAKISFDNELVYDENLNKIPRFKHNPIGFDKSGKGLGFYVPISVLVYLKYLITKYEHKKNILQSLLTCSQYIGNSTSKIGLFNKDKIAMEAFIMSQTESEDKLGKAQLTINFHTENQVSITYKETNNDSKIEILMFCFLITSVLSNTEDNESAEDLRTLLGMNDSPSSLKDFKRMIDESGIEIIDNFPSKLTVSNENVLEFDENFASFPKFKHLNKFYASGFREQEVEGYGCFLIFAYIKYLIEKYESDIDFLDTLVNCLIYIGGCKEDIEMVNKDNLAMKAFLYSTIVKKSNNHYIESTKREIPNQDVQEVDDTPDSFTYELYKSSEGIKARYQGEPIPESYIIIDKITKEVTDKGEIDVTKPPSDKLVSPNAKGRLYEMNWGGIVKTFDLRPIQFEIYDSENGIMLKILEGYTEERFEVRDFITREITDEGEIDFTKGRHDRLVSPDAKGRLYQVTWGGLVKQIDLR